MKEWWKDYFSFTKKERTGVIVLMVLIIALFIVPHFFQPENTLSDEEAMNFVSRRSTWAKPVNTDSLNGRKHDEYKTGIDVENETAGIPAKLFRFDPNTLTNEGWQKLGLKKKTIQTIQNYISKGGRFRRPEDIKRIYGLNPDLADRLILYADIKNADFEKSSNKKQTQFVKSDYPSKQNEYKEYKKILVDINLADTTTWIALPGIGSKLAVRIVTFRQKLGGFYSVEQVGETFGLADSVFLKIKSRLILSAPGIKQFDINKASLDELKQHPYIRWNIAQAIIRYREQHGLFTSIDDLSRVDIIDVNMLNKIRPYLVVN